LIWMPNFIALPLRVGLEGWLCLMRRRRTWTGSAGAG